MTRPVCLTLAAAIVALTASASARAQISLTTAVDLALRSNPRVRLAQADVDKALAAVSEARDAYVPSVSAGGSGYGKSYGFPLGLPTLVTLQAQSLVFSYSQRDYIRAARAGFAAANLALTEVDEAVAEDTILTYLALDHDSGREIALKQQQGFVNRLITIVQQRVDAGQDTQIELTRSRLTAAQLNLRVLQAEDDMAIDRARLAHLTGLPPQGLGVIGNSIAPIEASVPSNAASSAATSPGVDAAFENAHAKREQAFGDARYLFRPQISFAAQYNRLSTYQNSDYLQYYGRRDPAGNLLPFLSDAFGIGVQVTVPILDYVHRAKARESAADAVHAERDAEQLRDQFTEGRLRLQHSNLELAARAEIASLDQQLAQQQLDILLVQLNSGNPDGPQMTPKDEQNARIAEREKYLALLDTRFQLREAQVSLLRQTGQLEAWLKSTAQFQPRAQTPPAAGLAPVSRP